MLTLPHVDGFYLTLAETPGDPATLYALADWYEELGDLDRAACLRWTVQRGLHPFLYRSDGGLLVTSQSWHDGWYWWANSDQYGRDWGHPVSCRLPQPLWRMLRHSFSYKNPAVFKEYSTLRDAYEALFEAWILLGPARAVVATSEERSW